MPDSRVLAFCADLLFVSRIETTAKSLGTVVAFARTGEGAAARVAREGSTLELVLVDLSLKGTDAADLIRAVRSATAAPIIAFGSHVDAEALASARQAGATQALPRSAFTRLLPEILHLEKERGT